LKHALRRHPLILTAYSTENSEEPTSGSNWRLILRDNSGIGALFGPNKPETTKDSSIMRQRFDSNPDLQVIPIEKIVLPLKEHVQKLVENLQSGS
jgi:hypothetical protein